MAFIGASVIENDGRTWSWTDHSEIRYENWLNPSAVAIESQINQCSAINPVIRGKWFTVDCFRRLPFICEIPLL
uniref:C-type lectin domain-containing protein n=1 Tax=Panagrolaimus sp. JU765 TaxID=591449 RepID=A0AC34R8K8_9BILA